MSQSNDFDISKSSPKNQDGSPKNDVFVKKIAEIHSDEEQFEARNIFKKAESKFEGETPLNP